MAFQKLFGLTLLMLLVIGLQPVSAYDYSGTIYENGDAYWDDNEIQFIEFELE